MKLPRWMRIALFGVVCAMGIVATALWYSDSQPRAAFKKGLQAYRIGDKNAVAMAAEQLAGKQGFESHHQLLSGLVFKQNSMTREALEAFSNALGAEDTTGLALELSGEILYSVGDHIGAERMLLAAVQAEPQLVDAHRYLIATYYDIGAMDNVLKHVAEVVKLAPDDMRPWRMEGLVLKDFEKYDEAIKAYQGALDRKPLRAIEHEMRGELAECLFQVRRQEDALLQLAQIPETAESLSLSSECLLALGRFEEAEQSLRAALALEPHNLRALKTEATLLLERGEKDAALKKIEEAISIHPQDFQLRSIAMQTYQQKGDDSKADEQQLSMKKLRDLKDRFAALHIEAIRNPADAAVRSELGSTAVELGMDDAAVGWFKAALSMNPSNLAAREQLTRILAKQSQSQPSGK